MNISKFLFCLEREKYFASITQSQGMLDRRIVAELKIPMGIKVLIF